MSTLQPIERLAREFSRYPGIGAKTALRLAYFTLNLSEQTVQDFAQALVYAKQTVKFCTVCGGFAVGALCDICDNPRRTTEILCVVREAKDILSIEKTHEFSGRYHVLGGVISPMDGVGPDDIKLKELLVRIEQDRVTEIVLATSSDIEGEATASYIASIVKSMGVKVTRIAHGIPIGSNLEFVDEITLLKAFQGRREL